MSYYLTAGQGATKSYDDSIMADSFFESSNSMSGILTWTIISLVLAVVGGLLIYFIFLRKKNEGKFKGFAGWLYDFLSFKKMLIEAILKITYLIITIYITLMSFSMIATNFVGFLMSLIVGNLVTRILYEVSLILLVICRNTTDINKRLIKREKMEMFKEEKVEEESKQ